ncbi:MAG: Hsp20/alpha crystallin family protein [Deltaproteobacteria bacterium]|nr:Hsp20/alpha crystallin family protein [Deltaproteobacteria bacterium]
MLVHSHPFADFLRLDRDLDRFFGRGFGFGRALPASLESPVAVVPDNDGVSLRAELPGVDPAAITLTVEDRVLTISAERPAPTRENSRTRLQERRSGTFTYAVRLADDLDAESISARAEHGVLTVRIAKRAEVKPRQIEVKVS